MTAQPSIDSSFSVISESTLGDLELSVEKYIRSLPQHVVAIRDNFIRKLGRNNTYKSKKANNRRKNFP